MSKQKNEIENSVVCDRAFQIKTYFLHQTKFIIKFPPSIDTNCLQRNKIFYYRLCLWNLAVCLSLFFHAKSNHLDCSVVCQFHMPNANEIIICNVSRGDFKLDERTWNRFTNFIFDWRVGVCDAKTFEYS